MRTKKANKNQVLFRVIWIVFGMVILMAVLIVSVSRQFFESDIKTVYAFPGAEGFGAQTPGGRFGRLIFVTNLNDTTNVDSADYPGSLRWAVEQTWADDPNDPYEQRRFIIFKVGGTINLSHILVVKNPFVTIAGQTAPGDGIMLRGEELDIATHDVIVRGLRVRVGDEGSPDCCRDGISVATYYADSDVYNVIVDHNSISWAIDENMSIWAEPTDKYSIYNITFQWNIISEGLNKSIHVDEGATTAAPHSMGLIIGDKGRNITIHHNMFSHNWGRNPHISGIDNLEVINNVVYGWDDGAFEFGSYKAVTHIINNYFKSDEWGRPWEIFVHDPMPAESQAYLSGNLADDPRENIGLFEVRIFNPNPVAFSFSSQPLFKLDNIKTSSAKDAYAAVLKNAGAIVPARDSVDTRVLNEVLTRTGNIIDSPNQVGGWPDLVGGEYLLDTDEDSIPDDWENEHGSNPNDASDANSDSFLAPSGYTWIEEYVNSLIPQP